MRRSTPAPERSPADDQVWAHAPTVASGAAPIGSVANVALHEQRGPQRWSSDARREGREVRGGAQAWRVNAKGVSAQVWVPARDVAKCSEASESELRTPT
jgi:hypothetical protein